MKLLVFTFLIALFISCGENKTDKEENTKVETPVVENTPVVGPTRMMTYNFKKGDQLNYKLITDLNNSQHIQADTAISSFMNQTSEYYLRLQVNDVTENHVSAISITITKILAKADANGQKIDYDSKFMYSSRERMLFMDYEALKNKSFNIRITQKGEILDISGAEKIINEIIAIRGGAEKPTKEEKKQLEQQYIMATLAPLCEQIFRTTSGEPVGINSKWEQKYPSTLAGFEIENIAQFRITSYETDKTDSLAKIDANLSITWKGQNKITQEGVSYTFSDPNVSGSGVIYFNFSKGVIQKSETTVKMEMEMTMESLDSNQKPVKALKRDSVVNKSKLVLL